MREEEMKRILRQIQKEIEESRNTPEKKEDVRVRSRRRVYSTLLYIFIFSFIGIQVIDLLITAYSK